MEITIRPSIEADLPAIQSIRTDPLVTPHQYRLTPADTVDFWRGKLFGAEQTGDAIFRSHTILLDNELIGHVVHTHFKNERVSQFGWNLAPSHWGKGYASQGLSLVFDELAAEQAGHLFVADCFSANQRCRRLLERLGFAPTSVPLPERLMIALFMRCGHWIRRYFLKADDWKGQRSAQRKEKPSLVVTSDG